MLGLGLGSLMQKLALVSLVEAIKKQIQMIRAESILDLDSLIQAIEWTKGF